MKRTFIAAQRFAAEFESERIEEEHLLYSLDITWLESPSLSDSAGPTLADVLDDPLVAVLQRAGVDTALLQSRASECPLGNLSPEFWTTESVQRITQLSAETMNRPAGVSTLLFLMAMLETQTDAAAILAAAGVNRKLLEDCIQQLPDSSESTTRLVDQTLADVDVATCFPPSCSAPWSG